MTFDSMPSVYRLSDISFTLLSASLKRVDNVGFEHPKDLQSLGLLTMDNLVTNAGLLLCDQTILKQARIVCTRWRGTQKGMLDDALDDKEFTGSLIIQLEQAEAFATMHTMRPWRIEGFRRIETPDYPDRSAREVLVNALVHRDYQVLGSEIHVDMFDDRMEIVSPGGMKDGSKIQDRDLSAVPSLRRNELLADVFTRLNYMDRRGSGFSRILVGYPSDRIHPVFRSDNAFFSVSLPNLNQSKDSFIAEQDGFATKQDGSSRSNEALPASRLFEIAGEALKGRHLKVKTLHNVVKLYQAYGCTISFRRKDAAAITQLSPARMSKILEILVDEHLIYRETPNAFRFVTDWHAFKV